MKSRIVKAGAGIAGFALAPALYMCVARLLAWADPDDRTPHWLIVAVMAVEALGGVAALYASIRFARRHPGAWAALLVGAGAGWLLVSAGIPLIAWLTIVPCGSCFPG